MLNFEEFARMYTLKWNAKSVHIKLLSFESIHLVMRINNAKKRGKKKIEKKIQPKLLSLFWQSKSDII